MDIYKKNDTWHIRWQSTYKEVIKNEKAKHLRLKINHPGSWGLAVFERM